MELDDIKVKVETKYCSNCNHHYQDHFTDSVKYPKLRTCVCGMPLCCYGGCKCGEYSPIIKSVPYQDDKELIQHLDNEYHKAMLGDTSLPYQRIKNNKIEKQWFWVYPGKWIQRDFGEGTSYATAVSKAEFVKEQNK